MQEFWKEGDSLWVKIGTSKLLLRYIVPKGYIAIDGTSLTVCDVNTEECCFTFMLIEYTQKHIIVPLKKPGDKVNLEVDVIGKYIERSTGGMMAAIEGLESRLGNAIDSLNQRVDRLDAIVRKATAAI